MGQSGYVHGQRISCCKADVLPNFWLVLSWESKARHYRCWVILLALQLDPLRIVTATRSCQTVGIASLRRQPSCMLVTLAPAPAVALEGQFSFMAVLHGKGPSWQLNHFCGGTLVHPWVVMTAGAHRSTVWGAKKQGSHGNLAVSSLCSLL